MMPRDALMRPKLVGLPLWFAVMALLFAPLAWTASPSNFLFADGICRADAGAGHSPEKSSHQHDGCSQCQLGIGLHLLPATAWLLPGVPWQGIIASALRAPAVIPARFVAYASRAPPRSIGA